MSRRNQVQNIGTQDVCFDDSEFGFSVINSPQPSARDAATAAQHQEAASANLERARLSLLRAEKATREHMEKARENAQTSQSNASRASRSAGFHNPHAEPTGGWPGHAPSSRAEGFASETATANTQNPVVINQVLGEQTIGSVNHYPPSTAAPPTDCDPTAGVNTEAPGEKAKQSSMDGSQNPTAGGISNKERKGNGPPSWYKDSDSE